MKREGKPGAFFTLPLENGQPVGAQGGELALEGGTVTPYLAIHKFARLMLNGEPVPLYGNERDYSYVADILQGIESAIAYTGCGEPVYEIFNLSESRTTTLARLVELLAERWRSSRPRASPGPAGRRGTDLCQRRLSAPASGLRPLHTGRAWNPPPRGVVPRSWITNVNSRSSDTSMADNSAAVRPKVVSKPWGREIWYAHEDRFAGKILEVPRATRSPCRSTSARSRRCTCRAVACCTTSTGRTSSWRRANA